MLFAEATFTGNIATSGVVTIWEGSCGGLELAECNRAIGGAATVPLVTEPGVTYYFQVGHGSTSPTLFGEYQFQITEGSGSLIQANDTCLDATDIDLNALPQVFTPDLTAAMSDQPTASSVGCFMQPFQNSQIYAAVWYKIEVPAGFRYTGTIDASTTGISGVGIVGFLTGDCGTISDSDIVFCGNNFAPIDVVVEENQTLYVSVSKGQLGSGGPSDNTLTFDGVLARPTGACCVGGVCTVTDEPDCDTQDGTYLGNDTGCEQRTPYERTAPIPIPALTFSGTGGFASDTLAINESFSVTSVEVRIDTDLTQIGDYTIRLVKDGVQVDLLRRPLGIDEFFDCSQVLLDSSASMLGAYTFADSGTQTVAEATLPIGPGTVTPGLYEPAGCGNALVSLDSTFGGFDSQGDWVLEIETVRLGFGTVGTINNWSLVFNGGDDPCPCPGDINGDGNATVADILLFLSLWSGGTDPAGDTNNDGMYTVADILSFLSIWSQGCP